MQQILDAPKGGLEFNPNHSFALHVMWVLRSPTAAKEMIEKGFLPCADACKRDTPTTLTYLFRVSRDQRLAQKFKSEVKTIGQHPHYQPVFKSLEMKIPRAALESKLKAGGINTAPLDWSTTELIEGHEKELDYDPIVLECTELYLDARAFYEHALSRDWLKHSPEIWHTSRSLKPTTFCVGQPTQKIWDETLESSLKAIRFSPDESKQVKDLNPGVFVLQSKKEGSYVIFLELDLVVPKEKLSTCRSHLTLIQQELEAPSMIIIPMNLHSDFKVEQDLVEVRVMVSLVCSSADDAKSSSLSKLREDCAYDVEGRVIIWESKQTETPLETIQQRTTVAQQFASQITKAKMEILDGHQSTHQLSLAGYGLHPLYTKVIPDTSFHYKI